MKPVIYISLGLAMVAALYFFGVLAGMNLVHPVWRVNATIFGSLAGVIISLSIFWVRLISPPFGLGLEWGVILAFIVALVVTLLNARAFINAADFDPVAINLWHKGSYAVFASFIPAFAAVLAKLRIIGRFGAR